MLENPLVAPHARLVGSRNAELLDCTYLFHGPDPRHGWIMVVAASADNIATRIVNACMAVAPQDATPCADSMLGSESDKPWGNNRFISPITGFVNEPCLKNPGDCPIGFRHGVTIQYGASATDTAPGDYCVSGTQGPEWQRQVALTNATFSVYAIGRIAAIARDKIPGMAFPNVSVCPRTYRVTRVT